MIEEWKSYTRYQKIVLSIYFVVSLPLLPFNIIMIPFAHWVTQSANAPTRRITLYEFLCMAMAMSIMAYLFGGLIYCTK